MKSVLIVCAVVAMLLATDLMGASAQKMSPTSVKSVSITRLGDLDPADEKAGTMCDIVSIYLCHIIQSSSTTILLLCFFLFLSPDYNGLLCSGGFFFFRRLVFFSLTLTDSPPLPYPIFSVDFVDQWINVLLNIILQGGVAECGDLCSKIPNQAAQVICDLVCTAVGIDAFIHMIEDLNPDPIWICMEAHLCAVHAGGKANITSLVVQPKSGPVGSTFTMSMQFTVLKQLSAGEVAIDVIPPEGAPMGAGEVQPGLPPGKYGMQATLQAEPGEDEPFVPGTYKVPGAVCACACGSNHQHCSTYTVAKTSFQLTQ